MFSWCQAPKTPISTTLGNREGIRGLLSRCRTPTGLRWRGSSAAMTKCLQRWGKQTDVR
jgi:hypothetical protein